MTSFKPFSLHRPCPLGLTVAHLKNEDEDTNEDNDINDKDNNNHKATKKTYQQDQGDQCRSPGFYFDLDFIFKETFRFCNILVLVTFQFW